METLPPSEISLLTPLNWRGRRSCRQMWLSCAWC